MKKLLLFVFVGLCITSNSHALETVIFSSVEQLYPGDLKILYETKDDIIGANQALNMKPSGGDFKQIKTCAQYDEALGEGYYAPRTYDMAMESNMKVYCTPLKALMKVKPANQSFVRELKLNDMLLKQLSPSVGFVMSSSMLKSIKERAKKGETWFDIWPKLQLTQSNKYRISVIHANGGSKTDIKLLGWGDFNNDGFDDMLVRIYGKATGGRFSHAYVTILSRKSADDMIEQVSW
jgi:hypothetical protein